MKLLGFDTETVLRIELPKIPILLKRVLQNVKNPKVVLLCYIRRSKCWKAKFRNGLEIEFDRYCVYRVYFISTLLSKGYKVSKLDDRNFLIEGHGLKMIEIEPNLWEEDCERSYHVVDYAGKVVLDVGGYIGDTAIMFGKWGARKVIVYEPGENVEYIKRNVEFNNIDAEIEIHPFAVCDRCGEIEFMVEKKSVNTGSFGGIPGEHRVKLNAISWKEVLEDAIEKNVEIAKVDCEGCEKFLLNVKDELKKIPYWVMEIHNKDIEKNLVMHFTGLGFNYKIVSRSGSLSTIFFYSELPPAIAGGSGLGEGHTSEGGISDNAEKQA